ncbi:PREDICTED: peroxidase 6 [Tarenaya hassleriana]|uniref:peroxidase 6 n=1 Tax=Tarenaya hassleriana TaxID=28532 RepID=UPI00053C4B36|nr:PREDICTED: peroxidase 6 [Tarenaya hassleriana]
MTIKKKRKLIEKDNEKENSMRPRGLCMVFLLPLLLCTPSLSHAKLTSDYYSKSCPDMEETLVRIATDKQIASPTTAAGILRLFFHDCMVDGCDASILVASSPLKKSERDADINLSLPGDAFDLITRIKTAVELKCPGVVSCADILAAATRTLVTMVGGPRYDIRFGRLDSLVSDKDRVEGNLARPNMTMDQIISIFGSNGFSVQEMVALVGAHTIGFSHCKEFAGRIFNHSTESKSDPAINPRYATQLRQLCENYTVDEEMSAFNDVFTPGKFDNMYYKNLRNGFGLLQSDQALAVDERTRPVVDLYAANETAFFEAFAKAVEKVSERNVKEGKQGEVRRRCDQYNDYRA